MSAIVISQRSILAEGVIATLEKGGFGVVHHVDEPSSLILEHLHGDHVHLFVMVHGDKIDQSFAKQGIAKLRRQYPLSRIVLLKNDNIGIAPEELIGSEADALILGICNGEELIMLIKHVLSSSNKLFVSSFSNKENVDVGHGHKTFDLHSQENNIPPSLGRLSPREREILTAIAEGDSNKHLARRFRLSEATIKAHVRSIFMKLGARNRTTAALHLVSPTHITER